MRKSRYENQFLRKLVSTRPNWYCRYQTCSTRFLGIQAQARFDISDDSMFLSHRNLMFLILPNVAEVDLLARN